MGFYLISPNFFLLFHFLSLILDPAHFFFPFHFYPIPGKKGTDPAPNLSRHSWCLIAEILWIFRVSTLSEGDHPEDPTWTRLLGCYGYWKWEISLVTQAPFPIFCVFFFKPKFNPRGKYKSCFVSLSHDIAL